jgi:nitroreductase
MNTSESIKQPATDYPVHPVIASRWSPRAYDSKPIEKEKLQRIFEAARWAASSNNLQPWYFLVGLKGDEVYRKITTTLVEFNQLWAVNAPVLVLAIAKTTNSGGDQNRSFSYDLGQAVTTLSIQAISEGIYPHQMGGFDASAAERVFEIPEEYKVLVVFTLGYPGDAGMLHPKLQKLEMSPRSRRPVTETVFTGSFGHQADFL